MEGLLQTGLPYLVSKEVAQLQGPGGNGLSTSSAYGGRPQLCPTSGATSPRSRTRAVPSVENAPNFGSFSGVSINTEEKKLKKTQWRILVHV